VEESPPSLFLISAPGASRNKGGFRFRTAGVPIWFHKRQDNMWNFPGRKCSGQANIDSTRTPHQGIRTPIYHHMAYLPPIAKEVPGINDRFGQGIIHKPF